jgi:hypothetical protein
MKKLMFILALLLAVISQSFAGFDLLWYKNIPNTTYIYTVAFSNDSKRIVCETEEAPYIFIYDALTGESVNDTIKYGLDKPFFSPDDKKIIGIMNNKFYSYDLATGTLENRFDSIPGSIDIHNFHYDKKRIFVGNETGFHTIDFETGKIIQSKVTGDKEGMYLLNYLNKTNQILSLKSGYFFKGLDPKGNPIYEHTRRINLYDNNTLDSIGNFYNKIVNKNNGNDFLNSYKLTHKQDRIALIFSNIDKVEIYEFPSMKLVSTINIYDTDSIEDLIFTSDDKYLIIAQRSSGDNLSQWEVATGKLINERNGGFNTLDLTNNDRYIGTSGANMLAVFVVPTTDITNPKENQEILYPNPTSGFVNIKVPILEEFKITVNNEKGDIVLMPKFVQSDPTTISIDLNKLANGIYFLNLSTNNFNQSYKLIICK